MYVRIVLLSKYYNSFYYNCLKLMKGLQHQWCMICRRIFLSVVYQLSTSALATPLPFYRSSKMIPAIYFDLLPVLHFLLLLNPDLLILNPSMKPSLKTCDIDVVPFNNGNTSFVPKLELLDFFIYPIS